VAQFNELLQSPRCFHRDHLPGHITASAWIVDDNKTHALLIHHAKLNRWLQPGGHADGDENILNVATREVHEETGLTNLTLLVPGIFDLDIHPIPTRKDFPHHDHYDVRYLVMASPEEKIIVSEESLDVRWVMLGELETFSTEVSLLRMRDKVIDSFNH